MNDNDSHETLTKRMDSPGWRLVTGRQEMPIQGTLRQMLVTTHDRKTKGEAPGLIEEIETELELDMLQIESLWRQIGLPI